ncbi:MAG TPA: hypothetical protein DCW83_05910 [Saprospirales bacterium]|jgi:hypothetical protein|nr:hypothetical protein [Saprospirales bacterium]
MAKHKIVSCYTKSGAAFNTITEAIETHMAASSATETTIAEYESWVDGQTNFTETKSLTSNGSAVASGTAGNGYALTRTWTQAKLAALAATWTSLAEAKGEPTTIGTGWTVTHTDTDPASGNPSPVWGGDGTGGPEGSTFGVEGI